ncbi:MAG TPA: deoxyribonuclease IV [candidate division Zixibacteria bacterium]
MSLLGAHMSISGGVFNSLLEGEQVGCNTVQIFTKSSNQWQAKTLSANEIDRFYKEQERTKINPVVAHNSYLINLGSPDRGLLEKSRESMLIELGRCGRLSIPYLVIHPGSHLGDGEKKGIKRIADSINWLLGKTAKDEVKIGLETTAGQGSNIGYRFEQLAEIMGLIEDKKRVGICYDTCHTFAAGYDIRNKESYEKTWKEFDRILGTKNLLAIHMNDSKKGLGSKIDRHEHIGKGEIGLAGFKLIMNDQRWENVPKILETPKKEDKLKLDKMNLATLRRLIVKK